MNTIRRLLIVLAALNLASFAAAQTTEPATGTLRASVHEAGTKTPLPCRAWVIADGQRLFKPAGPRCIPYAKDQSFACYGGFEMTVPAGDVVVHVERGKEYLPVETTVHVAAGEVADTAIELSRWINMSERGWYSADLHVHFGVGTPDVLALDALADDVNWSPALGLWNQNQPNWPFPPDEREIWADSTHLITQNNQEVERIMGEPFESLGAPLMFGLTQPVYFPNGLTQTYPLNVAVCRQARQHSPDCVIDTDKPIWAENVVGVALGLFDAVQVCHNHYNRERTLPLCCGMAGNLLPDEDKGLEHNTLFARTNEVYYRYLNCGFKLAATGGSAMGVMPAPLGYGRTYAWLNEPVSEGAFLRAIRAGRTFATNGPLMALDVNGRDIGETLHVRDGERVTVQVRLATLHPNCVAEVIQNGNVVASGRFANADGTGPLRASFEAALAVTRSGWIAARVVYEDPEGDLRQAHTSPIYTIVEGKPIAFRADAEYMLAWIDELERVARQPGRLPNDAARDEALQTYDEARAVYRGVVDTARDIWGD